MRLIRSSFFSRSGRTRTVDISGFVETVRQLDKASSYPNALADLDGMVTEILLTEDVRNLATTVPASLHSLDAVHVASALTIGEALDCLVTYGKRMLDAARESGLDAFAPGATT